MKDFTLKKYRELLVAFKNAGYEFYTFEQYLNKLDSLAEKFIILRHDVDLKVDNSVATAVIENELGINSTYYFRVIPESNQPDKIKKIASLGHEVGYHYEDMSLFNGDIDKAYEHFKEKLEYFRGFYPVKTICMHGAPTSKYDGKDLWKKYDYKALGIIGEPYFDIDFSGLFYLTDTGMMWDGYKVSVRDKIPVYQDIWVREGKVYHSSDDIISAIDCSLPTRIMITTHPQRWSDSSLAWWKEFVMQSAKNIVKRIMLKVRS
jgi:hypothetical protein